MTLCPSQAVTLRLYYISTCDKLCKYLFLTLKAQADTISSVLIHVA